MKNSDNPAMPLSGDAYQDFASYDGISKTGYNPECQGLTKREIFAMHAMASWINHHGSAMASWINHHGSAGGYGFSEKEAARSAVECADALLEELEK